jgi:diguanylate cyclase (GGDEF)-like protein/putative nucleotidyltransferase with HDIG domain
MRLLPANRGAAVALVLSTLALAACALEFTRHISPGIQHFVVYWLYNGLVLAAGAVCVARGISVARDRVAWILIGSAVLSWGVGNTVWTFAYVSLPHPPYPSIADAFWLAVYPPVYVALLLLLRTRAGSVQRSLWLDGIIASLAVASVGTAVVFDAVLKATSGSKAAIATNLTYPLADLTLIAMVVWALAVSGWRVGRSWGLIAAGLLVFSVSDCLYLFQTAVGAYVAGGATDLGWVGGCVLLAWAAWQPPDAAVRVGARLEGSALVIAPVTFGLAGLGVLVYDHFVAVNLLSLVLAAAAIVAVIARWAITYAENMHMLAASRLEARSDMVTGLGNRRKLVDDLDAALNDPAPHVLTLFDLNGFKQYNDSFGHPAGDALLTRLGEKLGRFVAGRGAAYRMGGDEFCILCDHDVDAEALVEGAARALCDHGEGFAVTAAHGSVFMPGEATTASEALRLADQRMYEHKQGGRGSASEQSSLVLLRALAECHPTLDLHVLVVAQLAEALAQKLGLPQHEVARVRLAAALHDVGKMAIPEGILDKRGPLTEDEWSFMHRHTIVGARILDAAPALSQVGPYVRSSHERFDGNGYPDGLAGNEIPIASRIIFVCDAFDAMTSDRPYARALTHDAALAELQRNAGTQFDPTVVAAFTQVLAERAHVAPPMPTAPALLRLVDAASA